MSVGADRHILSRGNVVGIRPILSSGAERVVFDRLAHFTGGEDQARLLLFEVLGHPTHEFGKRRTG